MISIRPYDFDRCYVSTGNKEYLVELTAYNCNGYCSCRDFQMVHQPLLEKEERNGITNHPEHRCKHLKAILGHRADQNPTGAATKEKEE